MGENIGGTPEEYTGEIEDEESPEIPKTFRYAIILGSGMKLDPNGETIGLTLDSKLRVLAGGLLAREGKVNELILTGGKTAGADNPSEAETMKLYLLRKYPDLADFPIRLEETSIDTATNAEFTSEMLRGDSEGPILLITNDYHMLRASKNFQNQGLNIEEMPAEEIVSERSSHHERFIREYLRSCEIKKKQAIEVALRGMMKLDPKGKLLTALAHKLRGGGCLSQLFQ